MISTEMDVVDRARGRYTDIQLPDPQIGRGLSAAIVLNLVLDGLSVVECTQAGPFNSRDVDEHILATAA
jgi:hypothetical protein